jgi:hypothetical protein
MRTFLLALSVCAACGKPPPGMPIDVVATNYDPVQSMQVPLTEGGPIDLVRPPQGGFVVFVGVQVRNVADPAGVTVALHAALADPSGTPISEDTRTVSLVPAADDATLFVPDLRSFTNVANVAVCPSSSTTDRFNQPFQIEVDVTEASTRRTGRTTVGVVPTCRQSDPVQLTLCECECAANYFLGKCTM